MEWDSIYAALDAGELRSVASSANLPSEEVHAQTRLICWEIACGARDYQESRGSLRAYVMGCLWGWAMRESMEPAHRDSRMGWLLDWEAVIPDAYFAYLKVPGELTRLIERQERDQKESALARSEAEQQLETLPWRQRLARLGLAQSAIAGLIGQSRQAVQRSLRNLESEGLI